MKKLMLALLVLFPALAWSEPMIVFQTEEHDFGDVRQGEQLKFTFEFSNKGTDELIVGQVNTFT